MAAEGKSLSGSGNKNRKKPKDDWIKFFGDQAAEDRKIKERKLELEQKKFELEEKKESKKLELEQKRLEIEEKKIHVEEMKWKAKLYGKDLGEIIDFH